MPNFPHGELSLFNYAYISSYRKYTRAYLWCRTNTKNFWQVTGDPDTQIYQFAFIDEREFTLFLINHSGMILHARAGQQQQ
jgi:hypothetical protein